jgi:hypothetical protein
MPPKNPTPPISIGEIGTRGVIQTGVVDDFLMPNGAVSDVLNLHFDKIGSATRRKGATIIDSQIASSAILGLHQFLDAGAGTDDQLITVNGTVAYYLSGGSWTSKRTGLTSGKKADFTNFIDLVFMVNGTDAMNTWTGASGDSFGTTNAVSAPASHFIENFRSRVWALKTTTNPSRVTHSSVAASDGTILWTGDDSSFIDIAPGDGEDITGGKKFAKALYVFKKNFVYRIYSINETDPDPQIFVGTWSHASIELAKNGMYWHHPSGIYRLRRGESQPTEISKPINDIIQNVSRSFYEDVNSWSDDDHVYFSVGDVTVNGETTSNCVVRFTISTEVWTIYSYAMEIRYGAQYDDGTTLLRVVGDDDGNVYTFDSGNDDNGTAINYLLETRSYTLTGLRSETKTIRQLSALHENAQGVKLGWRADNMSKSEIKPLGQLENQESLFKSQDISGHRIKFNLYGSSLGEPFEFHGFEILEWINEGVI